MGLFENAEKKIEGLVNGAFARVFKGDVQPVEIVARLQKELDTEAELLSREKKLVPNDFTIGLSKSDYDRLFPYSKTMNEEIIPQIRSYANSQNYVFNGPVSVKYICNSSLPTGRFTVLSEAVASVAGADASTGEFRRCQMVVEVNGIRHPLVAPGLFIGRGTEADLRINDPGISRKHAQIVVSGPPLAPNITIEDLGSTNGIKVNGQRVTSAPLVEGTRIDIGTTQMLVLSSAEAE